MAGMYEADQPMKMADVGDTIFIAESTKTPVSAVLKRGKRLKQMLASYPAQKYPTRGFGGTVDGTDVSSFGSTTRREIKALAMWLNSASQAGGGWMVSKLANLVEAAGVGRAEKAKQIKDDGLLLAQMTERQLLSNVDMQEQALPNTPWRSRGMYQWLNPTAQGVFPVHEDHRPASACTYTGALSSFLPANMKTMLAAMATAKKEPVDLVAMVGLTLKTKMSTWSQRDTEVSSSVAALVSYTTPADQKQMMQLVDFFKFDAGKFKAMTNFYQMCDETTGEATDYTPRSGLWLDMKMWELRFLQQPMAWTEPPKSGGPRGYHDVVYMLCCLNPLGQGYVLTDTD